jgi:hypothetical protein
MNADATLVDESKTADNNMTAVGQFHFILLECSGEINVRSAGDQFQRSNRKLVEKIVGWRRMIIMM